MLENLNLNSGTIYLYILGVVFMGVVVFEIITGSTPNPYALGYISIATGLALHSTGVQQGVETTNNTVGKTAIAQYPLTTEGIATAAATKQVAENEKASVPR
jgi:hypothetical protein